MGFSRTDFMFPSHGDKCSAWLYLPDNGSDRHPLVVMAHGFGGMKNCGLEPYAEYFADNGLAVLLFDYRGFGDSEGTPRQLISHRRHIEDYHAAVAFARRQKNINPDKIALWGSSYSGGHAIVAASQDPKIAAIVVQVPFVSGIASSAPIVKQNGAKYFFKAAASTFKDLWRAATAREPYMVPVYGAPDEFAVLNTRDSKTGYESLIPQGLEVVNAAPARVFLTMVLYRPLSAASKVNCPALIIAGEKDSLIPLESVKKAASKMRQAELITLPLDHFEPYLGEPFKKVSQKQLDFLKAHLF
ncbi:MAG: alpha/beta fold hydrolase [Clostridiales bacterium]|jgi:pimeloyl-ACP methyl ester carboxylesterase|nr:alpha/beta fold hydrolase [Clostridiales bacterium]HQA05209.1 alpha/beta fold hydrolase [Clostridiales bacterium]HQD72505.1 alpha/beta fold hydrolase [Clostridiales bacterium]